MKIIAALCFALLCTAAFGQPAAAPDLEPLKIFKATPAYEDYWRGYVHRIDYAYDHFMMAAAALQCDKITEEKSVLLIPAYRTAIEDVMKEQEQIFALNDPAVIRYGNRVPLFAYSRLNEAEKASLQRLYKDKNLVKTVAVLEVLDDFTSKVMNPRTGAMEPASPVWLKTYFQREGELKALRKAIGATKPALLKQFDKVKSIEAHSEADGPWLSRLTSELLDIYPQVIEAYTARIPKRSLQQIEIFYAHPLHGWMEKASAAQGNPMIDAFLAKPVAPPETEMPASEAAQIKAELNAKYPLPPGYAEKSLKMGPYEYAGKQVERFCPPVKK